MNSADSWFNSTVESFGLAELSQKTLLRGSTCAVRIIKPGAAFPPWQSMQPSTTFGDVCIESVSMPLWHSRHPALFRMASCWV
jgi:hypothetical protein